MGHQAIVVHARVALIDRHGVLPMLSLNCAQAFGYQLKGLIPADCLPITADAALGLAQAVGITLDILQGHCLGTDMATAEAVLGIALDRANQYIAVRLCFGFDAKAANSLAEMTCTVMKGLAHGLASCSDSRRPVGSPELNYGASHERTPVGFVL